MNAPPPQSARYAPSVIELVLALIILGIIAAMSMPRYGRAGVGGEADGKLVNQLALVRRAISLYAVEHGGAYPGPGEQEFAAQLTQYTNRAGRPSPVRTGEFTLGPYLASVPPAPVGENRGRRAVSIDAESSPPRVAVESGAGWAYNPASGQFIANTLQKDGRGRAYAEY